MCTLVVLGCQGVPMSSLCQGVSYRWHHDTVDIRSVHTNSNKSNKSSLKLQNTPLVLHQWVPMFGDNKQSAKLIAHELKVTIKGNLKKWGINKVSSSTGDIIFWQVQIQDGCHIPWYVLNWKSTICNIGACNTSNYMFFWLQDSFQRSIFEFDVKFNNSRITESRCRVHFWCRLLNLI